MNLLVYFFCVLLLVSALMVIIARNPLYSILFLICSFFSASVLLFLFENEFLALFFLIIYLGAISILFLFVIMMLNIKYHELQNSKIYFPIGFLIGSLILLGTYSSFSKVFSKETVNSIDKSNVYLNWYDNLDSLPDFYAIGQVFYSHYVLQILISGLILYVAVIGVAFLTVKSAYSRVSTKNQSIFKQLSRTNVL
jgi:NADH-quinone oxidoreductase subunit J